MRRFVKKIEDVRIYVVTCKKNFRTTYRYHRSRDFLPSFPRVLSQYSVEFPAMPGNAGVLEAA